MAAPPKGTQDPSLKKFEQQAKDKYKVGESGKPLLPLSFGIVAGDFVRRPEMRYYMPGLIKIEG